MSRIRVLPDALINQIAAGEVVERPASVVKELVENSLDAGARQIDIDCEQAGVRLIRVRDDGGGMEAGELPLALQRHATSKIREPAELGAISTMGFRGEALPSIGSVSRLALTSCRDPGRGAWRVGMEGRAEILGPEPAAHPPGTTVEVRDLFFNTPARRRFLKSERTEFLHVYDFVRRAALAATGVGMRFSHNGQLLLALRPAGGEAELGQRLAKVCGSAFARGAWPVDENGGGLRLWGWLAPAAITRNQSDLQYWFVNGRCVRDARLQHALRLAYGEELPAGRHPAYVLYLETDPAAVDVNVHPAKSEVRFVDGRLVHDFVHSALRRTLGRVSAFPPAASALPASVREEAGRYRPAETASREPTDRSEAARTRSAVMPQAEVLGVVAGRYLLARMGDELMILDMRLALTELYAERLAHQCADGDVTAQPLLFPATVEVDVAAMEAAQRYAPRLGDLGLEVTPSGPAGLLVRTMPAVLRGVDPAALIRQVLTGLAAGDVGQAGLLRQLAAAAALCAAPADPPRLLHDLDQHLGLERLTRLGACRRLGGDELGRLLNT